MTLCCSPSKKLPQRSVWTWILHHCNALYWIRICSSARYKLKVMKYCRFAALKLKKQLWASQSIPQSSPSLCNLKATGLIIIWEYKLYLLKLLLRVPSFAINLCFFRQSLWASKIAQAETSEEYWHRPGVCKDSASFAGSKRKQVCCSC